MFDHAFYSRVNAILAELRSTEVITVAVLGACLTAMDRCMREAEVRDECVRQFLDLALDRVQDSAVMTGPQLAEEIRALLDEMPGLGKIADAYASWSDSIPGVSAVPGARTWCMKELDNRMMGLNLASPSRLRSAIGLTSERPMRPGLEVGRRRRFRASATMRVSDRHDAAINGDQVNHLIRCLGWGDSDSDPRGGRHAILG